MYHESNFGICHSKSTLFFKWYSKWERICLFKLTICHHNWKINFRHLQVPLALPNFQTLPQGHGKSISTQCQFPLQFKPMKHILFTFQLYRALLKNLRLIARFQGLSRIKAKGSSYVIIQDGYNDFVQELLLFFHYLVGNISLYRIF